MKKYMPCTKKLPMRAAESVQAANYSVMNDICRANYPLATGVSILALLTMLLTIVGGCGPRFDTAPVSGEVKLNGKAIAGIAVTFEPVPGGTPVSTGVTDASGRYSLRTVGDPRQDGALVGSHRIRFLFSDPSITADMSYEQANAVMLKNGTLLPPPARDGSMTFDVLSSGTSTANFELNSPRH
jgi:hypothetical protein